MARMSHPHAMAPSRPGRTRTAPPRMPREYPMQGRYRAYTLFDATGVVYLLFHALALASVVFVGVRFFRLFPKAQPPKLGPAKPPPQPVILAMLYAVWLGATLALGVVLAGGVF